LNIAALASLELENKNKTKEQSIIDLINRIDAIGLMHELIYTGDSFSNIDINKYIRKLTESLRGFFSKRAETTVFHLDIEPLRFSTKVTTMIGILLSELMTNTFKYAEVEDKINIFISLHFEDNTYYLTYTDSGKGLSEDIQSIDDIQQGTGLMLIKEFVAGLEGTIDLDTLEGTTFKITFSNYQ
jgi:two-component sensor histidine kinase